MIMTTLGVHLNQCQQDPPLTTATDHDYKRVTSPERSSTAVNDHNYSKSSERSTETQQPPSPRSSTVQHAIYSNIQDFTIEPNNHEQYDLFFFCQC